MYVIFFFPCVAGVVLISGPLRINTTVKELKKHISDAAMVGFDEENDVKQQKIEETADDLTSVSRVPCALLLLIGHRVCSSLSLRKSSSARSRRTARRRMMKTRPAAYVWCLTFPLSSSCFRRMHKSPWPHACKGFRPSSARSRRAT